jgi:hypothetical protein
MTEKERVATEEATGMEDARENQNEEFGRGDQEFGGGPGEEEYGEEPGLVGKEGIVMEGDRAEEEAAETAARERRASGEPGPEATATTETEGWDKAEGEESEED